MVHALKTHVVAIVGVARTGIAQSSDEPTFLFGHEFTP
jgi:hypothetical protein